MTTMTADATDAQTRLRGVLRLDAAACAAFGVLMTAGAPLVDRLFGLAPAWAVPFGVYLLGCAVALALVAGYPDLVRGQVIGVVANNVVAAAAMAALPFTGLVDLTAAGYALMLAGAALVALFAVMEEAGVRRLAA
ncbi:hypothetical protein K3N28_17050 [Glycomyces sp. TRM65418]|uniref:hypothetical protein n=1 Tax=Glycomyces sp. TRM65418 TaxID=2867006 RepID=UPI001CE5E4C7|nr:hypothetical protein [Glycomyces sp. TRM65418]MCC3764767.1 hypothetical protein [Glycomyces sp. TRM65418]QZD54421.1 hypothetical protein K3N28_16965 [Glycomyces sp. TRM65418]